MKRLVGGDYLLDLSPIEIEESVDGETYTSITDKSVLDQLTGLKAFIGKSGMIKPVWVKLLNGETDELIVTRGSLSTSDGVTFLIKVLLVGFILTLSVEFTQAETEDHTPLDEWYIDDNDAKYILVSEAQLVASIIGTGEIENAKPIYWHTIKIQRGGTEESSSYSRIFGYIIILNNSPDPVTISQFKAMLATQGVSIVLHSGSYSSQGGTSLSGMVTATRLIYGTATTFDLEYWDATTSNYITGGGLTIDSGWEIFQDLGANKIN